jgi:hypothetical protein
MKRLLLPLLAVLWAVRSWAVVPAHAVEDGVVRIRGVGPDNPILYDNDFWTDVPDAAYVWAKASLGEARLVGNVITRCTYGWEEGYAHGLPQQREEAQRLMRLAKESGLRNIPEPVVGSTVVLRKPASGVVSETRFERTAGSALIVSEAAKATTEKPLLVFVGGSCTTLASAFLEQPSITNHVVVFQVDGGGYNGSDRWAWDIAMRHFRFVNWAQGYFWDKLGEWHPERFEDLPRNPLCDFLRGYSITDLGRANRWGDGAWLFQLFAPGCITAVEELDGLGLTVPLRGNVPSAMEAEFLRTLKRVGRTPGSGAAGYHELRIYNVSSNKMEAVLERFRGTVEPVRRRLGIETVGYWTAPGTTNGGTFAYLLSAASREELARQEKLFGSDPEFRKGYAASEARHGRTVDGIVSIALPTGSMAGSGPGSEGKTHAFELRLYSVLPGKLDAFRDRWRDFAVPIYRRHGLQSIGWWIAESKDAAGRDQFVCLLAGESLDSIPKSIAAFHADPEWRRVEAETERGGKLREGVVAHRLLPTDFSALK